jgi:cytochrome c-type biogenesis protein CcmH/NrfF
MSEWFRAALVSYLLVLLISSFSPIFSQSTTTNLKDEKQVAIFLEVTSKIRCICLPSLPIQACSFNMCSASAYLKNFIENRIQDGMSAQDIVSKMEHGFGEDVLKDSVVMHFKEDGNQGMVDSLVYGFGEKILAKPDSTWINATLFLFGIFGLTGIFFYFRINKKNTFEPTLPKAKTEVAEIQKRIRDFERET